MMTTEATDRRAPMASAPMKYHSDGQVAWGEMWDTFCELALDGGPPHRGTLLAAPEGEDATTPAYQAVASEIARGVAEVSVLRVAPSNEAGWLAFQCPAPGMNRWLAEAIVGENVAARTQGDLLLVPCGAYFTLKGEIKNVITAVAKTTHYWDEHLPNEVKQTLAVQARIEGVGAWVGRLFQGKRG
jgi:sirohydrochlorin cobaltochelatase